MLDRHDDSNGASLCELECVGLQVVEHLHDTELVSKDLRAESKSALALVFDALKLKIEVDHHLGGFCQVDLVNFVDHFDYIEMPIHRLILVGHKLRVV